MVHEIASARTLLCLTVNHTSLRRGTYTTTFSFKYRVVRTTLAELMSCVKVEVDVLDVVRILSVDVKQNVELKLASSVLRHRQYTDPVQRHTFVAFISAADLFLLHCCVIVYTLRLSVCHIAVMFRFMDSLLQYILRLSVTFPVMFRRNVSVSVPVPVFTVAYP